jgi:hypothetical protein
MPLTLGVPLGEDLFYHIEKIYLDVLLLRTSASL